MRLTTKQICTLRGQAHALIPAVQLGKSGYSPAFIREVGRNLHDHELIKVRLDGDDRSSFVAMAEQLAMDTTAHLVATVGRIAVLFKRNDKAKIKI